MTKDTTIHLPPIFEHADFSAAADAINTLLAGTPSTDQYLKIVPILGAAQSQASRQIHFLENERYGLTPTGMKHSIEDCGEVLAGIRRAWGNYKELCKPGAKRPREFDLRSDPVSELAFA